MATGAIYFNSSSNIMFNYTGSAWVSLKPTSSEQTAINSVNSNASNINAVAGKATEVGRLGTTDAVADMAILGTASVVNDLNVLGTADVVNDLNVLGTAANVTAMNTLGTAGNVTAMSNCSGSIASINTTASNIADVNNFANIYRIASSDPGSSLDEGDLVFRTDTDTMRVYNGSAWQDVAPVSAVNVFGTLAVSGQSNIVADSTTDTLTFAGSNITITTNAATDTVTFTGPSAGASVGLVLALG